MDALIAAKWMRIKVSRAIHETLAEFGDAKLVRTAARGRPISLFGNSARCLPPS